MSKIIYVESSAKPGERLPLASMFLEERLNKGLEIEIPSLGIILKKRLPEPDRPEATLSTEVMNKKLTPI